MARSIAERERLLDMVERAMLTGLNQASAIGRACSISRQAATRYKAAVEDRWSKRDDLADRDRQRRRLIQQADYIHRRAHEAYAVAINAGKLSAACSALGRAIAAQERVAKLLGLDSESLNHSFDEATLEQLRSNAIARAEAEVARFADVDPIRELYGIAIEDNRPRAEDAA
jgi:hypothetical protein